MNNSKKYLLFGLLLLTIPTFTYFIFIEIRYRLVVHRQNHVIASYLAESGIQYALNRIEKSCWLKDIHLEAYPIPRDPFNDCELPISQVGHYIHHADQNPLEILDFVFNDESHKSICDTTEIPLNSSFSVWLEPTAFRPSGNPIWNGEWVINSIGESSGCKTGLVKLVHASYFSMPYSIFASRYLSIDMNPDCNAITGAFWSNGQTYIGPTSQFINEIACVSAGNLYIEGKIDGDVLTSSILFNSTNSPEIARIKNYISGNIELRNAYQRECPIQKEHGHFNYRYKIAEIWSGSKPFSYTMKEYCTCRSRGDKDAYKLVDAINRTQCINGFDGEWDDTVEMYNYPAIAAKKPGIFPEEARLIADASKSARNNEPFNQDLFNLIEGIPCIYETKQKVPDEDLILLKQIPELDWDSLKELALSSPEPMRKSGTVFQNWEDFSKYINDPSNSLVHHFTPIDSTDRIRIKIGNYVDSDSPGQPIIIYICKSASDEGKPDLGCFGVTLPSASLEINGSLVCETGFDLRDLDSTNPESGRWRDYCTGNDGRVVAFCGGMPMKRAIKPLDCAEFNVYKWSRDGVEKLIILGYPEIPAISAKGDLWIIGRTYETQILGPVYAPNGRIFLFNPSDEQGISNVHISGYIMGQDVELRGACSIHPDPLFESSTFYKGLDIQRLIF